MSEKISLRGGTKPCCAKCGHEKVRAKKQTFEGVKGILVYCDGCGSIVSWAPRPWPA